MEKYTKSHRSRTKYAGCLKDKDAERWRVRQRAKKKVFDDNTKNKKNFHKKKLQERLESNQNNKKTEQFLKDF